MRRSCRPGVAFWQRIVKVFGIRAVVGHTATRFLEDDCLMLDLEDVDDSVFPCIAHNTQINRLNSVIKNGQAPGGDGITQAVHSKLSSLHVGDSRLQESSRAGSANAIIHYSVAQTKPVLKVTLSGVLATRRRIPGSHIERIWVKRSVPTKRRKGRMALIP